MDQPRNSSFGHSLEKTACRAFIALADGVIISPAGHVYHCVTRAQINQIVFHRAKIDAAPSIPLRVTATEWYGDMSHGLKGGHGMLPDESRRSRNEHSHENSSRREKRLLGE